MRAAASASSTAGTATAQPVVRVEDVNHFFGHGEARNQVLFGNAMEVEAWQFVAITGPSGVGKTTLLTLVGALRSVQQGRIGVLGHNLARLGRHGWLRCGAILVLSFRCTICSMLCQPTRMSSWRCSLVAAHRPRGGSATTGVAVDFLKETTVEYGSAVVTVTNEDRVIEKADRLVRMIDGRIVFYLGLHEGLRTCEFLKTVDGFKELTPIEATNVAENTTKRRFVAGDVMIRKGDRATISS